MRMRAVHSGRIATGVAFTVAAQRYWLSVFPRVQRELRHWQRRARAIPDYTLRQTALAVQSTKRGNLEGSTAFAPPAHRFAVIPRLCTRGNRRRRPTSDARPPHTTHRSRITPNPPRILLPRSKTGEYSYLGLFPSRSIHAQRDRSVCPHDAAQDHKPG
jgi:hypothetical protein